MAGICACAVVLSACGDEPARPAPGARVVNSFAEAPAGSVVGALQVLEIPRTGAAMLSVFAAHRPCRERAPREGTIEVSECGRLPASIADGEEFRAARVRIARETAGDASADALHGAGLVEALYPKLGAGRLREAATLLEDASQRSERPATILADLSGVHILLAEAEQSSEELYQAIETAEEALEAEPRNPVALFNAAKALQRMRADWQAGLRWKAFLALGEFPGWSDEARRNLHTVTDPPGRVTLPTSDASDRALRRFAREAPQEARLFAMDSLLGRWGDAFGQNRPTEAADFLRRAKVIGKALESRGGDRSVDDMVRAVEAQSRDRAGLRRLAAAHAWYGRGQTLVKDRQWDEARRAFIAARDAGTASPALNLWAAYFKLVMDFYQGGGCLECFQALRDGGHAARYSALGGRIHWSAVTLLLRSGDYQPALLEALASDRAFSRLGEMENLGAVQSVETEVYFALNDRLAALSTMHRSLTTLHPFRSSLRLHNHLKVTADIALASGFPRTALILREEDVRVAEDVHPKVRAEALLSRAATLAAVGHSPQVPGDLALARRLLTPYPDTFEVNWLSGEISRAEALFSLDSDPRTTLFKLDPVLQFFQRTAGSKTRLLDVLLRQSEAYLALGMPDSSEARLVEAAELLDSLSSKVDDAAKRAAILEAGRAVFDQLAMLHARAGHPDKALAALERGRASFARGRRTDGEPARSVPPGRTVVNYALIGDTLLTFTLRGSDARMEPPRTIERTSLRRTIAEARSELERRSPASRPLAELYDVLIRPVNGRLGRAGEPVVIVVDGELAAIPFAALLDDSSHHYLGEAHPLPVAGSLRDAVRAGTRAGPPDGPAVFVANPAFDRDRFPELAVLPPALTGDVRQIAAGYPNGAVITGKTATRSRVERELRSAAVFHFSGHSIFNDRNPSASALVLAPDTSDAGQLTPADLLKLDLGGLRLVVLSACETQRAADGRTGGFAGLSGAMLARGAGGVVGSLWKVDDELTRALMIEFHQRYRATGDAADALWRAQNTMLRSGNPDHRSPAAWAGFRYTGN